MVSVDLTDGVETSLVATEAPARAFVPRDNSLDATSPGSVPAWVDPAFDDSAWISGTGGIGFELGAGNGNTMGIDLLNEDLPPNQRIDQDGDGVPDAVSFYSRFTFTIDPAFAMDDVERLLLRMKFDDGFVAFLNGTRIVSENAPIHLPGIRSPHGPVRQIEWWSTTSRRRETCSAGERMSWPFRGSIARSPAAISLSRPS